MVRVDGGDGLPHGDDAFWSELAACLMAPVATLCQHVSDSLAVRVLRAIDVRARPEQERECEAESWA